jgi:hypothetical protein
MRSHPAGGRRAQPVTRTRTVVLVPVDSPGPSDAA